MNSDEIYFKVKQFVTDGKLLSKEATEFFESQEVQDDMISTEKRLRERAN